MGVERSGTRVKKSGTEEKSGIGVWRKEGRSCYGGFDEAGMGDL